MDLSGDKTLKESLVSEEQDATKEMKNKVCKKDFINSP